MAGVDYKSYSGYRFRIGAATESGKRGLLPATIQTHGQWESTAYLLYIRMSRAEIASVFKLIGTYN